MTSREPDAAEHLEICATMYRFAAGIDLRDWELYRSVFADEIDVDYSSYRAGSVGRMRADDWVERGRVLFTGLDATQHCLFNPRVSITDDRAELMMYVQAEHFLANTTGDNSFALGGYYADRLVRVGESWKIVSKTLVVTWNRGNRDVLALAMARGRARLGTT